MGSNQFQKEYIEYLQEQNAELIKMLNHMKETYKNKILSEDFNKHYIKSTLEDVSNICTQIPQEIDLFFDKMTSAMGVLKNILSKKSEMLQLGEKISKAINMAENHRNELMPVDGSGGLLRKIKTGAVSPVMNSHIISTEPRIYLNEVSEINTPTSRNEGRKLSSIIEVSPETCSDSLRQERKSLREISVPVERLNLNKLSFNYMSEESPKSRFKGPQTWKKSLSSGKHHSNSQGNQGFLATEQNIEKKIPSVRRENVDPLEGPSWLHDDNENYSSPSRLLNYRRRKHRYATVFDEKEQNGLYEEEMLKSIGRTGEEKEKRKSGVDVDEVDDDEEECCAEEIRGKRDSGKIEKRITESSVDIFCESKNSSECEENVSPCLRRTRGRRGTGDADLVEKEESNFNNNKRHENSSPLEQLEVSSESEGESEESKRIRRSNKSKRSDGSRSSRAVFDGKNSRASLENSPLKFGYEEKRVNLVNRNCSKVKEEKNCLSRKNLDRKAPVRVGDSSGGSKTVTEDSGVRGCGENCRVDRRASKSDGVSNGPGVSLGGNEGRKRRKAAPTVLVEPTLKTKLRRN